MSFNDRNECSLYSFNGIGYQISECFNVIGNYKNDIFVCSDCENPVKDKADNFSPYKITEFGQRLIEKARKSVNISKDKFEFIVNSFESCSEIKEYKKFSEKNVKILVFAINRIVKNCFFDVLRYCQAKKFGKKYFCGGLPHVAAKMMNKKILNLKHRVLNVFRLNFEKKSVFKEFFFHGFDILSEIINKIKAKNFFYVLKGFTNAKVIQKSVYCLEKLQKTRKKVCFHKIKKVFAASKIGIFLIKTMLEHLKKSLESVKIRFFNEKSSKIIAKLLKKREKKKLLRGFVQIKKNYSKNCTQNNISIVRLFQQLNIVLEILNQAKLRQQKTMVIILFDINSFYPLKSLLRSYFRKLLKFLIPKSESFSLLFLKALTKPVLREKILIFNKIIPSFFYSVDKDFTFISPIKNIDKRDPHERCNTLDFPSDLNSIRHNPSDSIENLDFKKFLLLRAECKSVLQKESAKPP